MAGRIFVINSFRTIEDKGLTSVFMALNIKLCHEASRFDRYQGWIGRIRPQELCEFIQSLSGQIMCYNQSIAGDPFGSLFQNRSNVL
jgi:hypothetical protein